MDSIDNRIEVFPPHGFVRYVESLGNEAAIVNAARISLAKEIDEAGLLEENDIGLIKFLMREKHGTPFEQGFMSRWHIRMPIFVMREWVRHRVGFSINEESGRYVELRSDFYQPDHLRTQKGKPGAYTFEVVDDPAMLEEYLTDLCHVNEVAWGFYQKWFRRGVAKEQCRFPLPLNLYTEMRWTANARSMMNFLELRNDKNAMYEIRQYAQACEYFFSQTMPNVHAAFEANGRIAP